MRISKIIKKIQYIYHLIITTPNYKLIIFLQLISGTSDIIGLPMLIPVLNYMNNSISSTKIEGNLRFIEVILNFFGLQPNFYSILGLASLLILIAHCLTFFTVLAAANAQITVLEQYRKDIFKAYSKANWLFLIDNRSGEMNYSILKEAESASAAHINAQRIIIYIIQLLALIYIALKLSLVITVLAAIVYIILTILGALNSTYIFKLANEYNEKFKKLANDLNGLQQNKKFLKTSLLNAKLIKGIFIHLGDIAKNNKKQNIHLQLQQTLSLILTFIFLISLMFFHKQLSLSYSVLLLILFIFLRVSSQFSSFATAYANLDGNIPMHQSLQKRLNDLQVNEEKNGSEEFKEESSIRFENISFSYPDGGRVFDKLNITIDPHKITAFIGSSGVGKSTLLDLTLGLLEPDSGTIYYGNIPHDKLNKNFLRSKIAYVSQETTLIDDTLMENLTIGNPEYTDAKIKEIIEKVDLTELINELPNGLDTHIGENGVKLSGGQRQRLALARALFMDPEILILDEATSSLDSESEYAIQDTIRDLRKDLAIIIVTHKLSAVRFADKIYVLEKGCVCESGGYKELLEQKGKLFYFDSLQK